jgi:hypothetical protein
MESMKEQEAKQVIENLIKDLWIESLKPKSNYNKIYSIIKNIKSEIENNGLLYGQ